MWKYFIILSLCFCKNIFGQVEVDSTIARDETPIMSSIIVYYLDGDSSFHTEQLSITSSFGFNLQNGRGLGAEFIVHIGDNISISPYKIDRIIKDGSVIEGRKLRTYSRIATTIPYLIVCGIVINNYFIH